MTPHTSQMPRSVSTSPSASLHFSSRCIRPHTPAIAEAPTRPLAFSGSAGSKSGPHPLKNGNDFIAARTRFSCASRRRSMHLDGFSWSMALYFLMGYPVAQVLCDLVWAIVSERNHVLSLCGHFCRCSDLVTNLGLRCPWVAILSVLVVVSACGTLCSCVCQSTPHHSRPELYVPAVCCRYFRYRLCVTMFVVYPN